MRTVQNDIDSFKNDCKHFDCSVGVKRERSHSNESYMFLFTHIENEDTAVEHVTEIFLI